LVDFSLALIVFQLGAMGNRFDSSPDRPSGKTKSRTRRNLTVDLKPCSGGLRAHAPHSGAATISLRIVADDLRRGFTQFDLVAHFLEARNKCFNLLLLVRGSRFGSLSAAATAANCRGACAMRAN